MCTETVFLIQLMLNLQKIKTGLNLSSACMCMHLSMLSLCVYFDLYGIYPLSVDCIELRQKQVLITNWEECSSLTGRDTKKVFNKTFNNPIVATNVSENLLGKSGGNKKFGQTF